MSMTHEERVRAMSEVWLRLYAGKLSPEDAQADCLRHLAEVEAETHCKGVPMNEQQLRDALEKCVDDTMECRTCKAITAAKEVIGE